MIDAVTIYKGLDQGSAPVDWYEVYERYDVVISLVATQPITPCPAGKMRIVWKIDDWEMPTDTDSLWALVGFITDLVRRNKLVLVHCGAGLNRAGLVCALAYRELTSCSGTEAEDYIKRCRSGALMNPYFVTALRQLDGGNVYEGQDEAV